MAIYIIKNCQSGLKILPNTKSTICQKVIKFCQSSEISPNLGTLPPAAKVLRHFSFITYNFSKEHFAKVHRRTLLTFSIWSAAVIFSVWCSFNRIIDILITYVAERNVLTSTSFLAQSCQTNLTLIMVNLLQRLMWHICESYEFFTLKCRGLRAARTSIIKHVSYGWYLV